MESEWFSDQRRKDPPPFFLDEYNYSLAALSTSLFSLLSREIRDQIYDILWEGVYYPDCGEGQCAFDLVYGASDTEGEASEPCTWVLTCKTFLVEGTIQFYRKARCVESFVVDPAIRNISAAKHRITSLTRVRHIEFEVDQQATPFEIILHRDFWISTAEANAGSGEFSLLRQRWEEYEIHEEENLRDLVDIKRYGDPTIFGLIIPDYNGTHEPDAPEASLDGLIPYLKEYRHSIKTLRLHFSPADYILHDWAYEGLQIPDTWYVDMSYLEKLGPGVERVEFTLSEASSDNAWELEIYRKTQQEMGRVAKYLVGGSNGGHWALRDWVAKDSVGIHPGRKCWHLEVQRLRSGPSTGHIASHTSDLEDSLGGEDDFGKQSTACMEV